MQNDQSLFAVWTFCSEPIWSLTWISLIIWSKRFVSILNKTLTLWNFYLQSRVRSAKIQYPYFCSKSVILLVDNFFENTVDKGKREYTHEKPGTCLVPVPGLISHLSYSHGNRRSFHLVTQNLYKNNLKLEL